MTDRLRQSLRDEDDAKPLTAKEKAKFERLVGKAAGNPKVYEHQRKKAQLQRELAEIKEAQRVNSLPKRPKYEEPGSITLPRFVFTWLESSREGEWTVADVETLVALLGMFENHSPELIPGSSFEETADGELELVVSGGADAFRFRRGANGDPMIRDAGSICELAALQTLLTND